MKKLTSIFLLSSIALSSYANTALINYQDILSASSAAQKISNDLSYKKILSELKESIPTLVIFDISNSGVGSFKQIMTNAGMIFVDNQGNIIMGGQRIMLINYDNQSLSDVESIKSIVTKNTGFKISRTNTDSGLVYMLSDHTTIITSNDISKNNYAIMGAYTTADKLTALKGFSDKASTAKVAAKPITDNVKTTSNGNLNALNYIFKNYPDNVLTFKATSKEKGVLTIFTDYTCPHCKDLHKHLPDLLKQGYTVKYILMPREGFNGNVAANMQKALCSINPNSAVENLYQFGQFSSDLKQRNNCDVSIKDNLSFAKGFNITGTPTIIASNGSVTDGFTTVYGLLSKLNLIKGS